MHTCTHRVLALTHTHRVLVPHTCTHRMLVPAHTHTQRVLARIPIAHTESASTHTCTHREC